MKRKEQDVIDLVPDGEGIYVPMYKASSRQKSFSRQEGRKEVPSVRGISFPLQPVTFTEGFLMGLGIVKQAKRHLERMLSDEEN
jgi:hypothetical protein